MPFADAGSSYCGSKNRLLPLGRMLCEAESADAYVELLEAIAGAEGSPAFELLHSSNMVLLSYRGKAVISGVSRFEASAQHL
jgi:hypothetical protein